jgi:hypothetical protein
LKEHVASLKYKPHIHDKLDFVKESLENEIILKEGKKKAYEKVGNYAKYVKEMYWPKVSE